MLKEVHFLLSYMCTYECDHCFVFSSPNAEGTFTVKQVQEVLDEAVKTGTVDMVVYEGGEPFLFYPILLEGIRLATQKGLKTGIVTNSYFATTTEDAEFWMKPLIDAGLKDVAVSDDEFHYDGEGISPAFKAAEAAKRLGMPTTSIHIDKPVVAAEDDREKGAKVLGGGAMLRGRAADKLTEGLPVKRWDSFFECPYEDLLSPSRVHVDTFGHVHLCQGLSMGNMWKTPLSKLLEEYDPMKHPIVRPLVEGGPSELAKAYKTCNRGAYVDACHLCYMTRKALIDKFPEYLVPRNVYGL